jgi:hypothetical protein
MRSLVLVLLIGCGASSPPVRAPIAAPADFCPALIRGDLDVARAAARAKLGAATSNMDAAEAWMRTQFCVRSFVEKPCSQGFDHAYIEIAPDRGYIVTFLADGVSVMPSNGEAIQCMSHQDELSVLR